MAVTVGPQLNVVESDMRPESDNERPSCLPVDHRAGTGGDVDWHSLIKSAREPGEGSQ